MNNKRFDIVSKYKIWFLVPVIILIFSLIMFGVYAGINKDASQGIAIGIEFQGGSLLNVNLGQDQLTGDNYNNNKKIISEIIEKNNGNVNYIQKSGTDTLIFKYSMAQNLTNEQKQEINDNIINGIRAAYPKIDMSDAKNLSAKFIGPSASKKLINTALISILISTLLILLYILVRFELFSAVAAVSTLALDVLTMFMMMIVFHIQINSTFIAAVITIVSYSINNTIVIFDRIRENYKLLDVHKYDDRYIINISVRDTLVRSITTTVTTLFSIVLFAILGVSSVREFALPVIFGLLSGLFTSVCVAPSIFMLLKEKQIKKKGSQALSFKK